MQHGVKETSIRQAPGGPEGGEIDGVREIDEMRSDGGDEVRVGVSRYRTLHAVRAAGREVRYAELLLPLAAAPMRGGFPGQRPPKAEGAIAQRGGEAHLEASDTNAEWMMHDSDEGRALEATHFSTPQAMANISRNSGVVDLHIT